MGIHTGPPGSKAVLSAAVISVLILVHLFVPAGGAGAEGNSGGAPQEDGGTGAPAAGDIWQEPATGMAFVWVPGGCFMMGTKAGGVFRETRRRNPVKEEHGFAVTALSVLSSLFPAGCTSSKSHEIFNSQTADERPVREVCVDGFWMGQHEVTNAQFRHFRPSHDSGSYKGIDLDGDRQPVVYVSWYDVRAFVEWLNRQGPETFRLPTEAEWEYACRAGNPASRFWGDDPHDACTYANVHDNDSRSKVGFTLPRHRCSDGYVATAPVGSYKPNAFGLYDMLGNVWEWCEDIYTDKAYTRLRRKNPVNIGGGTYRVRRGGSWCNLPRGIRCSNRGGNSPEAKYDGLGFRIVRQK